VTLCAVLNCRYVAESSIDDFQVCALHDHPNVRAILERLKRPGAYYWSSGHPIVLPCGELTEADLVPHEAFEGATRAGEATDWPLCEAPDGEAVGVREEYRLKRWVPKKLTREGVLEIRRLRKEGVTLVVLAERFGVAPTMISRVARREAWSHVP
jgi:hypothetical protein